ncbi:hypothetical protein C0R09_02815 [Brevibacillus laterosporus]|uniref:S24 family peptidase n=1 Tax=Brevibacillus laterosporus TaxID=1465 RepID=UPI000C791710|nr:S24 family peptidase [Brevibacillus laterosporus]AUM63545.1 hypothetical protein C0R09_02815 [Brevibacillus laterosporus]
MNYYETLSQLIKESGLTLKEISEKCRELGVKIDPSYISKLQTKKQPPASDEINTALANVCRGDSENLLFLAHLERNPENIKKFIERTIYQFKESAKIVLGFQIPEEQLPNAIEKIDQLPPVFFLNKAIEEYPDELENTEKAIEKIVNTIADYKMTDRSMEPKIPFNSNLELTNGEKLRNGDYILVELEDGCFTVRRYVSIEDKVVLISENPLFKPIELNKPELKVIGKVKAINYKTEL